MLGGKAGKSLGSALASWPHYSNKDQIASYFNKGYRRFRETVAEAYDCGG